jgi:hypothetical protein
VLAYVCVGLRYVRLPAAGDRVRWRLYKLLRCSVKLDTKIARGYIAAHYERTNERSPDSAAALGPRETVSAISPQERLLLAGI